ncbi:hypothetical protein GH714_019052 [Hevea brasiliensis]|uniref:Uncharacterized protein n=1 Tax=Hevea brasiliensis TaxID=3981 RepID=A0A6A6LQ28_HEVBR|nr:hypothetical protein GH714_019052 [Hevea brasiliensis]
MVEALAEDAEDGVPNEKPEVLADEVCVEGAAVDAVVGVELGVVFEEDGEGEDPKWNLAPVVADPNEEPEDSNEKGDEEDEEEKPDIVALSSPFSFSGILRFTVLKRGFLEGLAVERVNPIRLM